MRRALAAALVVALFGGCGACGHKKKRAPAIDAGVVALVIDAAPAVAGDAALPPPEVAPTGVATCDRYQAVLIAALACDRLADNRPVLRANLDNLQRNFAAWPTLAPDARKAAMKTGGEQCAGGVEGVTHAMASAGCPP